MILSVIYLASLRRQKEEVHHNELVKYFRWQPQQDIGYFSDQIHFGTVAKKDEKINVSTFHNYFSLYIIIIILSSLVVKKIQEKKEHRHTKGVNETKRWTEKNGGRSYHCALSEP